MSNGMGLAYVTVQTVAASPTHATRRILGVSLSEFVAKERLLKFLRASYPHQIVQTDMEAKELKLHQHLHEYPNHEILVSNDRDLAVCGIYQWTVEPFELEGELL